MIWSQVWNLGSNWIISLVLQIFHRTQFAVAHPFAVLNFDSSYDGSFWWFETITISIILNVFLIIWYLFSLIIFFKYCYCFLELVFSAIPLKPFLFERRPTVSPLFIMGGLNNYPLAWIINRHIWFLFICCNQFFVWKGIFAWSIFVQSTFLLLWNIFRMRKVN